MAGEVSTAGPAGFGGRLVAYAKTLDGQATLIGFLICAISAIFMVQILPDTQIMGALGVLSIYFIVMLMLTGIARMVLKLFRRRS